MVFLSPRSGRQHKAWGASPRYDRKKHFEPTLVGDSAAARFAGLGGLICIGSWGLRPRLYAAARFAGLGGLICIGSWGLRPRLYAAARFAG